MPPSQMGILMNKLPYTRILIVVATLSMLVLTGCHYPSFD